MGFWKRFVDKIFRGEPPKPPSPPSPPAPKRRPPPRPRERLYLNLGIDFGTACSKMVIQSPYVAGRRAIAVPNPAASSSLSRYLFPSIVRVSDDSSVVLNLSRVGKDLQGFKVRLMNDPKNPVAAGQCAAHLAFLMTAARTWFEKSQEHVHAGKQIVWSVNLGIPSVGYDDEDIKSAFKNVCDAAWKLSVMGPGWNLDQAQVCVAAAASGALDHQVQADVVPEVVAEVVGYARSRQRREGLHVLVDVGATTVDICGFTLYEKEGEDNYALLTALVQPLGVHQLHAQRLGELATRGIPVSRGAESLKVADPLAEIPRSACDYIAGQDTHRNAALQIDDELMKPRTNALMAVLMHLKRARDPYPSSTNEVMRVWFK